MRHWGLHTRAPAADKIRGTDSIRRGPTLHNVAFPRSRGRAIKVNDMIAIILQTPRVRGSASFEEAFVVAHVSAACWRVRFCGGGIANVDLAYRQHRKSWAWSHEFPRGYFSKAARKRRQLATQPAVLAPLPKKVKNATAQKFEPQLPLPPPPPPPPPPPESSSLSKRKFGMHVLEKSRWSDPYATQHRPQKKSCVLLTCQCDFCGGEGATVERGKGPTSLLLKKTYKLTHGSKTKWQIDAMAITVRNRTVRATSTVQLLVTPRRSILFFFTLSLSLSPLLFAVRRRQHHSRRPPLHHDVQLPQ